MFLVLYSDPFICNLPALGTVSDCGAGLSMRPGAYERERHHEAAPDDVGLLGQLYMYFLYLRCDDMAGPGDYRLTHACPLLVSLMLDHTYQGVVTPICAVLRAATGVTVCDRPKTACDRRKNQP